MLDWRDVFPVAHTFDFLRRSESAFEQIVLWIVFGGRLHNTQVFSPSWFCWSNPSADIWRVFLKDNRLFLDFAFNPLEKLIYKLCRIDAKREMNWREYATSFVIFSMVGTIVLFLCIRLKAFI